MPRIRQLHLYAADAVVAAAAVAAYLDFGAGVPLALAVGLPLAVRRAWPLPALAVTLAAVLTAAALDVTLEPLLPVAFVLYLVGLAVPARHAVPALAVALISTGAVLIITKPALADEPIAMTLVVWLFMAGAWAAGRWARVLRARELRRAEHRAEQSLSDERVRIARELHDVMAHSMSLIAVKAAVANHVAEQNPGEVRDALRIIEETSRGTMTEMRRLLGVLRADAQLAPAPGLEGLGELAERARAAGLAVDLRAEALTLPESMALSVYRIVQESLTNVVKHAHASRCEVVLREENDTVVVEITDDGRGPAGESKGHGLLGMRERVSMFGGEFEAGRGPSGGFRVLARLKLGETR